VVQKRTLREDLVAFHEQKDRVILNQALDTFVCSLSHIKHCRRGSTSDWSFRQAERGGTSNEGIARKSRQGQANKKKSGLDHRSRCWKLYSRRVKGSIINIIMMGASSISIVDYQRDDVYGSTVDTATGVRTGTG
jgi:hypothetical protein